MLKWYKAGMDLRHIRTFVTVAELGTVSRAALRLRIAQPALSRQLIDLEQELGLQLFDRVGRRLLLTGEGVQLLSGCRILLNSASALTEQAQLLRHGDTGVLRIAGSPQHIEGVLAQFLHRYAERYPKVEVKISEGTRSEILALLERGEIHTSARIYCTPSSWTSATMAAFRSDRWNCWQFAILACGWVTVALLRSHVLPAFRCC